ncbi:MAG: dihydroxyacetone kinase subunit L [Anaerolineae bacterium]|nr:dihydroxyacetone kinase subunit L [Anaerolineae bacterium]
MKDSLTRRDIIAALAKMADDLTAEAERLRELDAAIGDGDLGITVTLGFQAVREGLPGLGSSDISTVLMRSGMAFNRKAASTFGALFATMMMRAARAVRDKEFLDLPSVAEMFEAATEGVKERGKADVGDKTMLDALVPAAQALSSAAEHGLSLSEGLANATLAAENGMLATVDLKSKVGRASWFSDRTLGHQDPGATVIYLMFRSLSAFVSEGD